MIVPTMLLAVSARAADVVAPVAAAVASTPLWMRVFGFLGASAFAWKMIQGQVPVLIAYLKPLALRGVDLFVVVVKSYPLLRWFVIGDKENFLKTTNALLDGLEDISNAVEARLKEDLDAASAGQDPPPAAPPPSAPPAAPPAGPC